MRWEQFLHKALPATTAFTHVHSFFGKWLQQKLWHWQLGATSRQTGPGGVASLEGTEQPFQVWTDPKNLKSLGSARETESWTSPLDAALLIDSSFLWPIARNQTIVSQRLVSVWVPDNHGHHFHRLSHWPAQLRQQDHHGDGPLFYNGPFHRSAQITHSKRPTKVLIQQLFSLHGLPQGIVSDQVPQFTTKFWSKFCHLLGISVSLFSVFHLQTNGQMERMNQELETGLWCLCSQNHSLRASGWLWLNPDCVWVPMFTTVHHPGVGSPGLQVAVHLRLPRPVTQHFQACNHQIVCWLTTETFQHSDPVPVVQLWSACDSWLFVTILTRLSVSSRIL